MNEKNLSASPVVDEEGILVGNVSLRDFRKVITQPVKLRLLPHPVGKFPDFTPDPLIVTKDVSFQSYGIRLMSS